MVIRSVHTGGGLTLEGSLNFKGGTGILATLGCYSYSLWFPLEFPSQTAFWYLIILYIYRRTYSVEYFGTYTYI